MEIQKVIVFNGIEYKLMGQGKYYLSQSKNNEGRKHAKGLHVAIWEFHNKKTVPKGYQIHHKDFNPYNNDISNLECISIKQHAKIHAKRNFENKEYAQNNRKQLDKAIEEALAFDGKPVFITDSGDNTTSGAPGWNTFILRQFLALKDLKKKLKSLE